MLVKKKKCIECLRLNVEEPFTSDFKITTREPSFVMHADDDKMKAHSSSKSTLLSFLQIA